MFFSEECNNFAALTRKTKMKNRSKWIALVLLIMWAVPLTCNAQAWHSVKLKSQITHPQPMTGLVLWPEQAKKRHNPLSLTTHEVFTYET